MNNLKGGSVLRLAKYRKEAEKLGTNWRVARHWSKPTIGGIRSHRGKWFCDAADLAWDQSDRGFGSTRTTGYYIDNNLYGTVYGVIAKFNAGKRGQIFIAGIKESESDGLTLFPYSIQIVKGSDEVGEELKRIADNEAEASADRSRDYYKKDELEQTIEREREAIKENKSELIKIAKELKTITLPSAVCNALKNQVGLIKLRIEKSYTIVKNARGDLPYYNRVISRYESEG